MRAILAQPWTPVHAIAAGGGAIGVAASLLATPNIAGITGAGLAIIMAAIAAIDARYFVIPDELNIAALGLALLDAGLQDPGMAVILQTLLRAATLALLFLGLRQAYWLLRRREGLGLGDVKLAGVAGAWLGWQTMPVVVEIAALSALCGYTLHRYVYRRYFQATHFLPFGLFLAPAIWLGWLLETLGLVPS